VTKVCKTEPAADYPPEEGCYLRGNDYSPVAAAVILRWRREETPGDIENLVRTAVESGAALAGTLQTENILNLIERIRKSDHRAGYSDAGKGKHGERCV